MTLRMRSTPLAACLVVLVPAVSAAQGTLVPPAGALSQLRFDQPASKPVRFDLPAPEQTPAKPPPVDDMKGRACPGCPKRNLAWPFLDVLWLNVMYNRINYALERESDHNTAKIGPKVWWDNMKSGFEWDNNDWGVNQFGHPYQGSNYFTAGRANGLGFYESAAVAAFGSGTWEYYFENNKASFNDIINTTVGGIAIGETLHRLAWMVRDPHSEKRKTRELFATAVDPLGGFTRMVNGDANRVADKPPSMIPSSVGYQIAGGTMWQGESVHGGRGVTVPFLDVALRYGDTRTGRSTVPFESFDTTLMLGGSDASQWAIRGRLFGQRARRFQFGIFQTFDFMMNHAYDYGGQGIDVEMGLAKAISPRTSLWMSGATGVTLLGAVNQITPGVDARGGADGSRDYDYGPGFRWGGIIQLSHVSAPFLTVSYQGYHVSVVDGGRANHVLQRAFVDGRVPLIRSLALGVTAEYFFRKAYMWGDVPNQTDEAPQLRVYVIWRR